MKLGLAIAPEDALPTSFVVFRDRLDVSIRKAALLGYDAIELALSHAGQANQQQLKTLLGDHGLHLAAISTGRVFAESRVWMTHPDSSVRQKAVSILKGLIEVAAAFNSRVNIGRSRGYIHPEDTYETAEGRFLDCLRECADFAAPLGVEILLEPVNRYEINFLNCVQDAISLLKKAQLPNVRIMPDVFHMNIEDASITGSFEEAGDRVGYVHFADSNRLAPGWGHLDFPAIIETLRKIQYDGYVTVEILPHPNPDEAAAQAVRFLRNLIQKE